MITKLMAMYHAYKSDIKGATAIEYGLIAGGISLAIVASVFIFGERLAGLFSAIAEAMTDAESKAKERLD